MQKVMEPNSAASPSPSPGEGITRGVSIMTGDPKKAILKLSGPMIIAMFLMMLYNLVDAVWVAGLGNDALAAIGFITPLFMVIIGLGNGLGAGAASAISRRIGADDKHGADSAAMHSFILTAVISVAVTVPLLVCMEPVLLAIGAGETTGLAVAYGQVVFGGAFFLLFSNVAGGVLRAEGDVKRAMYAMAASALLNAVLDPILMYSAGLGIAGAAWATVISAALVSAVLLYWFLVRRDTYVSVSWERFSHDREIDLDILRVGLPSSAEMLLISVLASIVNVMLVAVAGTDAVAVHTAGWRVVMLAVVPIIAVGTALIPVAGAAYGARRYRDLSVAYRFATKVGIGVAALMAALTFVFAPAISVIFTYSPETVSLASIVVAYLQVMCLFYLVMAPGFMASSIFQAVGRGMTSLSLTLLRELVFVALFAYVFAFILDFGAFGVWWGIIAGELAGSVVGYFWGWRYLGRLGDAGAEPAGFPGGRSTPPRFRRDGSE